MMKVKVDTLSSGEAFAEINKYPDHCPVCEHKVQPIYTKGYSQGSGRVQLVFRCPSSACQSFFIAIYNDEVPRSGKYLRRTFPRTFIAPTHHEEITKVSPRHTTIMDQAAEAESMELTEVAGMGYRKALEVLVKDFAMTQHPESEHADIKKILLGPCIKKYLDQHPSLVAMATRAAWLGNDESHYERKWEDKDIADLKLCLQLTIGWIVHVRLTQQMLTSMPEGKK